MKKTLALILSLCMMLTLVGSLSSALAEDVVTLRWVAVGGGMPSNYDAWLEKINPYLAEKIGVNIDMEVVSWGDWDQRRSVILSTQEPFDIMFSNGDVYTPDVKLNAFLDITELVKTTTPDLYKLIPEAYWDACKINGKIYAVPTYKDSSISNYFVWDKAMLDKYGIDASEAHTLQDVEPFLYKIHEGEKIPTFPLFTRGLVDILFEYDSLNTSLPGFGVKYDDKEAKVVSAYEQPEIMEQLKLIHKWYKDGIINSDAASVPEEMKYRACGIAQGWSTAAKTVWGPQMGIDAVAYQYKNTIISNETVRGSLNCISINSPHPEKALEFLQLINTDSYVRDSFFYGLEGDDWEYTADNKVHRLKTEWKMAGYTQGTFFKVTPTDDVEFNQWDEVKELNEKAIPSVMLGFTFDFDKVQNELSNCRDIATRYKSELLTGTVDPETTVPEMMKEMRAAGFDKIVEEAQAQVNEFLANNK